MTKIEVHKVPVGFNDLINLLWDGKLNENDFTAQASQIGTPVYRIEREILELKQPDGVA